MNFNTYQDLADKTAVYPDRGNNLPYVTLGLCGESGEVAEKVKKLIRDKENIIDDEFREVIKKELGDVLWYISQICTELNLTMDNVAGVNIDKLQSRAERGAIKGSGDDR